MTGNECATCGGPTARVAKSEFIPTAGRMLLGVMVDDYIAENYTFASMLDRRYELECLGLDASSPANYRGELEEAKA